jgi:predicted phosphoribosyltransferase
MPDLLGVADDTERAIWAALDRLERATASELALEARIAPAMVAQGLDRLCGRRVIMRDTDSFLALGAMART